MVPWSNVPSPNVSLPLSPDRAVQALVDEILKSRKICRGIVQANRLTPQDRLDDPGREGGDRSGQGRSGPWVFPELQRHTYQRLRQQVLDLVEMESGGLQEDAVQWAAHIRDRAYRAVLDDETLTAMAIAAQTYPPDGAERRRATSELVMALKLADRFAKRVRRSPHYGEALNRTLTHAYEKLDQYKPDKGPFMAWVNYWLDIFVRRVQTEQDDPLIQSSVAKIIREKNKLRKIIRSVYWDDVITWFELILKQGNVKRAENSTVSFILLKVLMICYQWGMYLKENHPHMDAYLFEFAQQSLGIPSKVSTVENSDRILGQVAAPATSLCLSEELRHYIETDPDRLFQHHIQGHPSVTFQAIALAYLDGTSWKALSTQWEIPIPSLSSFFQRQLKRLAPTVKQHLEH